jgi:hypothetical protein
MAATEKGCVTLMDEQYKEDVYNTSWQLKVCNYLEERQVVNTDNVSWQQAVYPAMNSATHIVPANVFTFARVNTFNVNYEELVAKVGCKAFYSLYSMGLSVYRQGAMRTNNNMKLLGDAAHTKLPNSAVVTKRSRESNTASCASTTRICATSTRPARIGMRIYS